ncbi:MAG TPA: hypothetical protein DD723_09720 [Candidatus Omnitrophica bacterium]|nr:MAG: hypothetical protein A2Z81_03655 [Omnitrophica WOR_2 bacterium GWA2_45_18]HBR15796.1 hypothetical protein [Candidatus Omnitrophota bacterium]
MRAFHDYRFREKRDFWIVLFLTAVSLFIFSRSLNVHGLEYRDDEIFYFESTREMLREHNFLSPTYFGENRFQKPVLYYWLILLSYQIFGVNWFAARFVAVVFASGTVCLTYLMARGFFEQRTALLSAVILMTIPLFFRHAKNAVPDMVLNFFIVLALYAAVRFTGLKTGEPSPGASFSSQRFSLLFFVACGLGFMVKGFAALIIPGMTFILYAFLIRNPGLLCGMKFGRGLLILAGIIGPWFVWMILTYGKPYLDYMLVSETKTRLLGEPTGGFFLLERLKELGDHAAFYLRVLLSYFAPWGLFVFPAGLLAFWQKRREDRTGGRSLLWLLIWFFVVFFFFSFMDFKINHYMLVLSTPLAILTGYFFVETVPLPGGMNKILVFLRRDFITFIFCFGNLAFGFLLVFLAGGNPWWLLVIGVACVGVVRYIYLASDPLRAPMALGIFILVGLTQTSLMGKAGLTAHATLQKFAQTVHALKTEDSIIGVGSHDIHEKEWQVYFDVQIEKAGMSFEEGTRSNLNRLFSTEKTVFCLMTERDFDYYLKDMKDIPLRIVQEEYIFRKRMSIDKGFWWALMRVDRPRVREYLMEKLILVKKEFYG